MAVTQLCPTYARRCFPCWDEPAIKAIFTLCVIAPKHCVTLNNMVSSTQAQVCNAHRFYHISGSEAIGEYLRPLE